MSTKFIRLFCFHYFLIVNIGFCLGQDTDLDSLLFVYNNEELTDAPRLQALIALGASEYAQEFPDSLLYHYKGAEQFLQERGGESDKTLYAYYRGLAHYRASRFTDGIECFQEAKTLATLQNDTLQIIDALSYLGSCYLGLSDFSKSLEMATEGLLLSEILKDPKRIVIEQTSIGLTYMRYGEYDESREYLNKALDFYRTEGDRTGEIKLLTNIGVSYSSEENFEKAEEYYLSAYTMAKESQLSSILGTILLNLGDCYLNLGDTIKATVYLREGLTTATEQEETLAKARGIIQFAHLYRNSNPDSALYFAENGLALAQEIGDLIMEENSLEILFQLYEDKGNYHKAVELHKLWKMKIETIFSEENERAVYESAARYAYEKQKLLNQIAFDKEIAKKELESQLRFYLMLGGGILLSVIFIAVFQIRKNRSAKEKTSLLHEMELIKERVAVQSVSIEGVRQELQLSRDKIEVFIGRPLGDSSWNILNVIFENPSISNRDIAEKVFLSLEGVSSSLRRMYRSFEVTSDSSQNLKVALIAKAVKISLN